MIACFEICVETNQPTDPDTDSKMVRGRTIKIRVLVLSLCKPLELGRMEESDWTNGDVGDYKPDLLIDTI